MYSTDPDQLNILLIDHYDSYTYNILQLITNCNDNIVPWVVHNNKLQLTDVLHLIQSHHINCIVLGPGPGNVSDISTLGVTSDIINSITNIPIFGICLGLQAVVYSRGGKVIHSISGPKHGELSSITHSKTSLLYYNIPNTFNVIRYNSLTADYNTLPSTLSVIAVCNDDNTIQAVQDNTGLPIYAVQYHPESICSEYGQQLMSNFVGIAKQNLINNKIVQQQCNQDCLSKYNTANTFIPLLQAPCQHISSVSKTLRLHHKRIEHNVDTDQVYTYLYSDKQSHHTSYWLDSSKLDGTRQTRFSYIGDINGHNSFTLTYQLHNHMASIVQHNKCIKQWHTDDIFNDVQSLIDQHKHVLPDDIKLPFDYQCGFAGYISYEMHQTTLPHSHIHQQAHKQHEPAERVHAVHNDYPDALFIFSDRLLVHDNDELCWYALTLIDSQLHTSNDDWLHTIDHMFNKAQQYIYPLHNNVHQPINIHCDWRFNSTQYKQLIQNCLQQLIDGNSYELCLTNHITNKCNIDPLQLYINLRTINPAPYASYFNIDLSSLPNSTLNQLSICSSSPERFVQVTGSGEELLCECKPIKGTISRGITVESDKSNIQHLQSSAKDYSENLMIVDLIRNDLLHICHHNTVHVHKLMHIETFATVHQLVSTIRGKLFSNKTSLDCVRSLFPPGSMTGAPKISSVDILAQLEQDKRGIYSGCIGYWSLNSTCDTSVVIRTIILTDGCNISIGVGGAITHQSIIDDEYNETVLKAEAQLRALQMTINSSI